jgi:DNA-binding NarL/FixJ family response regulator
MPRVGGPRFVEMLREYTEPRTRDTPVVILRGLGDQPTVIAVSRLRINGYQVKPISPKQPGD